ncbi:B22R family protein [Carp edema virus]|nr:B22R family protein [Carp edema virus]
MKPILVLLILSQVLNINGEFPISNNIQPVSDAEIHHGLYLVEGFQPHTNYFGWLDDVQEFFTQFFGKCLLPSFNADMTKTTKESIQIRELFLNVARFFTDIRYVRLYHGVSNKVWNDMSISEKETMYDKQEEMYNALQLQFMNFLQQFPECFTKSFVGRITMNMHTIEDFKFGMKMVFQRFPRSVTFGKIPVAENIYESTDNVTNVENDVKGFLNEIDYNDLNVAPLCKSKYSQKYITKSEQSYNFTKHHLTKVMTEVEKAMVPGKSPKKSEVTLRELKDVLVKNLNEFPFMGKNTKSQYSFSDKDGLDDLLQKFSNIHLIKTSEKIEHEMKQLGFGFSSDKYVKSYSEALTTSKAFFTRAIWGNIGSTDFDGSNYKIASAVISGLTSTGMTMTIGGSVLGPVVQGLGVLTMGLASVAQVMLVVIDLYEIKPDKRDFQQEFMINYKKFVDSDFSGINQCVDPSSDILQVNLGYRSEVTGLVGNQYSTIWTDTIPNTIVIYKDKNTIFESNIRPVCYSGQLRMLQGNHQRFVKKLYSQNEISYYQIMNLNQMTDTWKKVEFTCGKEVMLTIKVEEIKGLKTFVPKTFVGEPNHLRFAYHNVCEEFYLKKIGYSFSGCSMDPQQQLQSYINCPMLLETAVYDSKINKHIAFTDIYDQESDSMKVFTFTPGVQNWTFDVNHENNRSLCLSTDESTCYMPFKFVTRSPEDLRRQTYKVKISSVVGAKSIKSINKLGMVCDENARLVGTDLKEFEISKLDSTSWIIKPKPYMGKYPVAEFHCVSDTGDVSDIVRLYVTQEDEVRQLSSVNNLLTLNTESTKNHTMINFHSSDTFNVTIENKIVAVESNEILQSIDSKYHREIVVEFKPKFGVDGWSRFRENNHTWPFIAVEFGISGENLNNIKLDSAEFVDPLTHKRTYNELTSPVKAFGSSCVFTIEPFDEKLTVYCRANSFKAKTIYSGNDFYLKYETADEFCGTSNPATACDALQLGGIHSIVNKMLTSYNAYPNVDAYYSNAVIGSDYIKTDKYNGRSMHSTFMNKYEHSGNDYKFNPGGLWCCDVSFAKTQTSVRGVTFNKMRGINVVQKTVVDKFEVAAKDNITLSKSDFDAIYTLWEKIKEIEHSKSFLAGVISKYNDYGITVEVTIDDLIEDIEGHKEKTKKMIDDAIENAWKVYIKVLNSINKNVEEQVLLKDYFCCYYDMKNKTAVNLFDKNEKYSCDDVFTFKGTEVCYDHYGNYICEEIVKDKIYHTCFQTSYSFVDEVTYKEYLNVKDFNNGIFNILNYITELRNYLTYYIEELQIRSEFEIDYNSYNNYTNSLTKNETELMVDIPTTVAPVTEVPDTTSDSEYKTASSAEFNFLDNIYLWIFLIVLVVFIIINLCLFVVLIINYRIQKSKNKSNIAKDKEIIQQKYKQIAGEDVHDSISIDSVGDTLLSGVGNVYSKTTY